MSKVAHLTFHPSIQGHYKPVDDLMTSHTQHKLVNMLNGSALREHRRTRSKGEAA